MIWDLLLIAIVLYNMLRGASRGGRMLAAEVGSFVVTYAAVFTLGPIPAEFLQRYVEVSPFLASFLSALAIYFGVRLLFRAYIRLVKQRAASDDSPPPARLAGVAWGALRGGIAAIAIAVIVSGVARMQNIGLMQAFPAARASVAVAPANGLIEFVMHRFTRFAGPTTRQLVDLALEPDPARLDEFLHGPFVERMLHSEPVRAFAHDDDVRRIIRRNEPARLLTHPVFLRTAGFVMRELQNEPPALAATD